MTTITLKQIHEDLIGLKMEMEHIKTLVQEDLQLSDELIKEIEESRKRPKKDFISHEDIRKEFS